MAWLSAEAYDEDGLFDYRCARNGWQVEERFDHRGSEAFLVTGDRAAAIVFRGTEAARFRLRDVWSNLSWPWPTAWQGAGRVHSGYRRHLNMIPRALPLAERVAAERPLYATGHSMGGALACLFASWYFYDNRDRRPPWRLAGLVTFGAPKALDRTAAAWVQCPARRYEVRGDLAPSWPPVLGLVHAGTLIRLPPRHRRDGPLARHAARHYAAAIRG